jgi:hypothetical protein
VVPAEATYTECVIFLNLAFLNLRMCPNFIHKTSILTWTRCGYEVLGIVLLQAYLYSYSLLRGGHL